MFFFQLKSFSSTNLVQCLTWIKSKIIQILRKSTNPPEQLVALLVRVGLQLCHWLVLLDEFEELCGVHLRITTVKLLQRHGETRGYNTRPPVMSVYGCVLGIVLVVRMIITVSHWVQQPRLISYVLILSGWFCVFPQPTPLASIRSYLQPTEVSQVTRLLQDGMFIWAVTSVRSLEARPALPAGLLPSCSKTGLCFFVKDGTLSRDLEDKGFWENW